MSLDIIIVNWNTRDLLARCLDSVLAHPPAEPFTVWVVDNASTDGSPAMVRSRFPQVRLLENRENAGFARANNQAIRQSKGDAILLLNSDTEVKAGALAALGDFLSRHPDAGAVGPQTLNPDGSLQTSCYPAPTLPRELWRLFHLDALHPYGVYAMHQWDRRRPREVEVLLGACLLVRRAVVEQVGLLDEDYFMYSEEVDFCYRIRRAGWRLYWVPQAQIVHYGGQSTRQVAADMFLHLYSGKLMYFRKNYSPVAGQVYKLILLAASVTRLLLSPLAWLGLSPDRERHLTLAGRYWQLLKQLPGM
ncbi:MAG: glycosyltransferase family 2 protein [Caldilineae bacterium]|nr:MAG: glycosyltransferase family 2 protein [Caldilineae bacterium]